MLGRSDRKIRPTPYPPTRLLLVHVEILVRLAGSLLLQRRGPGEPFLGGSPVTTPDFSSLALGKLPPIEKPALMLAGVLTGVVPEVPVAADYFTGVPSWELGGNDNFGTCGPTSVANLRRLVTYGLTGTMQAPALNDVFDLYRRSGNPNFDPTLPANDPRQQDQGVIMQTMLEALLADGIGGVKPIAFAKIAPRDLATLEKAIAIFGGALLGLDLEVAQQTQRVWDTVTGSPSWGGHAVLTGRYRDAGYADVITWATDVEMTQRFVSSQEDEAWVVIWPEHLGAQSFLTGVDVDALASAYQALTGRVLPTPTPPAPTPGPADALEQVLTRFLHTKAAPAYLRRAAEAWMDSK